MILFIVTVLSLNANSGFAQITVSSNGAVKLVSDLNVQWYYGTYRIFPDETNSAYLGTVDNQFYQVRGQFHWTTTNLLTSDKRFKQNFRTIDQPLEKILGLTGKKYDFIPEASDSTGTDKEKKEKTKLKKDKLGLVAQEVIKIVPEAVYYSEEEDKYYMDYNALIPVIIEAMKVQQSKIGELTSEVASLKNTNKEKSAFVDELKEATLAQNIPNPFNVNTRIDVFIPAAVSNAKLYIYNMQGAQIKTFTIHERESTSITVEGNTFDAGMYLYTLITDGKEVDTKKMILTR